MFQHGFENSILNVYSNWIVCIRVLNFSLLYYIWKELIEFLSCFIFKSELFFIFSQFFFSRNNAWSESKGFTVFRNFLLSITFFSSKFWKYFLLPFSRETHIYSFVLHKAYRFLLFSLLKKFPQPWPFHYLSWEFFRNKKHLIGSNKFIFNRSKTVQFINTYFTKPIQLVVIIEISVMGRWSIEDPLNTSFEKCLIEL